MKDFILKLFRLKSKVKTEPSIKDVFYDAASVLTFLDSIITNSPIVKYSNVKFFTTVSLQSFRGSRGLKLVFSGDGKVVWSIGGKGKSYSENIQSFNPYKEPPDEVKFLVKNISSEKNTKFIMAAAILLDGVIYQLPAPARHHNIMHWMHRQGISPHTGEQGFVSDDGKFFSRVDALLMARESGQTTRETAPEYGLFSEDIW